MTNNEKIKRFVAAIKATNELRKTPFAGLKTQDYLSDALDKLNAAYGAEICAGLKPDQQGDEHET